jgi:hypothetical protein
VGGNELNTNRKANAPIIKNNDLKNNEKLKKETVKGGEIKTSVVQEKPTIKGGGLVGSASILPINKNKRRDKGEEVNVSKPQKGNKSTNISIDEHKIIAGKYKSNAVKDKKYSNTKINVSSIINNDSYTTKNKENKYLVAISTYERFDMVYDIYEKIKKNKNVSFVILNDCSKDSRYLYFRDAKNVVYLENEFNYGKKRYWQSINKLLSVFEKSGADYMVQMDDDFYINENFIDLIEGVVNKYDCSNIIIKYIHDHTKGQHRWNSKYWIDGGAVYPRQFWQKLRFRLDAIPLSRWEGDEKLSSGVWHQVSNKITANGFITYETNKSFCRHDGNEDSKMNPEVRKLNKLITKDFIND